MLTLFTPLCQVTLHMKWAILSFAFWKTLEFQGIPGVFFFGGGEFYAFYRYFPIGLVRIPKKIILQMRQCNGFREPGKLGQKQSETIMQKNRDIQNLIQGAQKFILGSIKKKFREPGEKCQISKGAGTSGPPQAPCRGHPQFFSMGKKIYGFHPYVFSWIFILCMYQCHPQVTDVIKIIIVKQRKQNVYPKQE